MLLLASALVDARLLRKRGISVFSTELGEFGRSRSHFARSGIGGVSKELGSLLEADLALRD